MANRRKRSPEKDARMIGMLRQGFGWHESAKRAGYSYTQAKQYMRDDTEFGQACEAAYTAGTDTLAEKVERRGFEGYDKPVWYKGRQVGTERVYSDTLAIFMLKSRDPRRFNDKLQVEHGGQGGGPIQITKKVFHVVVDPAGQQGQVVDAEFTEVQPGTQPALPSPDEQGQPAAPVTVRKREF